MNPNNTPIMILAVYIASTSLLQATEREAVFRLQFSANPIKPRAPVSVREDWQRQKQEHELRQPSWEAKLKVTKYRKNFGIRQG